MAISDFDIMGMNTEFDAEDNASFGGSDMHPMFWMADVLTVEGDTVTGFFTPTGNAQLDMAIEMYNQARSEEKKPVVAKLTVEHSSVGKKNPGEDQKKEYWYWTVGSGAIAKSCLTLIPLIRGVKQPEEDNGLVYVWKIDRTKKIKKDERGREKANTSYTRFHFLIAELLQHDFRTPLVMLGRGYKGGHTMDALRKQREVITSFRNLKGLPKDASVPFWSFAITFGRSMPVVIGDETPKKTTMPMGMFPAQIDVAYLSEHYFARFFEEGAESKVVIRGLVEEAIQWAVDDKANLMKERAPEEDFSAEAENNGMTDAEFMTASDDEITANEGQRKALVGLAKQNRSNAVVATLLTNAAKNAETTFGQASKLIDQYAQD